MINTETMERALAPLTPQEQDKVLCFCEGMVFMKNIMQESDAGASDEGTEKKSA